jgi:hypothetical protein
VVVGGFVGVVGTVGARGGDEAREVCGVGVVSFARFGGSLRGVGRGGGG